MCEPCGDTPEDNVTVFLVGADQKDQELRRAVFGKGISAAQTVFLLPGAVPWTSHPAFPGFPSDGRCRLSGSIP